MRQVYVTFGQIKGYIHLMQFLDDVTSHPQREEIENRVEIIKFFDDYGAEATRRAFSKSRSTVYLWKKKLKGSGGKLSALAPGDKTPLHKRHRVIHPLIGEFIIDYRIQHPGADKTTVTPALIGACRRAGVKPVSESSVGRIIHDLKQRGRLPRNNRIVINGKTGKLRTLEAHRVKKTRRKGFRPSKPGDLVQIDTVSIFAAGLKRYLLTAIDLSTRFAFAYTYKSSSSANAQDFLMKLQAVAPFPIVNIQTDNGHEFQKHFAQACEQNKLVHFFNYPRHPQSNGHLERFNRTVQEQFCYWHTDELDETGVFNQSLMEYLIWYNTEKPHRAIGKLPPLRYYLDNFVTPPQSNMLWTLTHACIFFPIVIY